MSRNKTDRNSLSNWIAIWYWMSDNKRYQSLFCYWIFVPAMNSFSNALGGLQSLQEKWQTGTQRQGHLMCTEKGLCHSKKLITVNKGTRLWLVDHYHNHITTVFFYPQQQRVYSSLPFGTVHHTCVLSPEMYCWTALPLKRAGNVMLFLLLFILWRLIYKCSKLITLGFFKTLNKDKGSQDFLQMKISKNVFAYETLCLWHSTPVGFVQETQQAQ